MKSNANSNAENVRRKYMHLKKNSAPIFFPCLKNRSIQKRNNAFRHCGPGVGCGAAYFYHKAESVLPGGLRSAASDAGDATHLDENLATVATPSLAPSRAAHRRSAPPNP